jgi:hypothetical protein
MMVSWVAAVRTPLVIRCFRNRRDLVRGKGSPPADRNDGTRIADGLPTKRRIAGEILPTKTLLKKMLQHVTQCAALHNIVCLTGHQVVVNCFQRFSKDDCEKLRITVNVREIKDKSSAVTYGSKHADQCDRG